MREIRMKVLPTLAGEAYDNEREYRLLDYIVIDGSTVYTCRKVDPETGVCKGHGLDETEWWDKGLDVAKVVETTREATSETREATSDARQAIADARQAIADTETATRNADAATANTNAAIASAQTATENADVAAENARTATAEAVVAKNNADASTADAQEATAAAQTAKNNADVATGEARQATADAQSATVAALTATSNAAKATSNADAATRDALYATAQAKTATSDANTATEAAQTATQEAENVNVALSEENVLEVTNRSGEKKSLDLSALAAANSLAADVERVKMTLGRYTPREDIVLTPVETNYAISADGVKVAKSGWAIAEFEAEKGNEYLFKPNITDGSVCIFAEKIDKVETRAIDYTYTYNEDGTIASATATYGGKTHVYSYEYSVDSMGNTVVTITDDTGLTLSELPYQYQTTVGSYSPLVRLNAGAELPEDGYCRFMSHFQGNSALKVAVSYKVGTADLTMKVVRDGVFASISTQLGNLSQEENETRAIAMDLKKTIDTFIDKNSYVGMARMNGDASCAAETTYGTKEKIHEMGAKFRLCTVKNGAITHVMAPGRLTLDENGEEVHIDGQDGDVMLCVREGLHLLKDTKEVEGREMNIIGIGDRPATWYGTRSKSLPPFGIVPCSAVVGKIFDDARTQMHCVYNPAMAGTSSTPLPIFKVSYRPTNGAGFINRNVSSVYNIQMSQAKNEDALTASPYMGAHFEMQEAIIAMLFAEAGSVDVNGYDKFGVGITNVSANSEYYDDEALSAYPMWKFVMADGTEKYQGLWSQVYTYADGVGTKRDIMSGIDNGGYSFVESLEAQRVLDGIAKAGLIGMMGDRASVFCYDDEGNMTCVTDGSVDVATGTGMTACKHYYKVRSVQGFEGMEDGVMTAVVNVYTMMECADGLRLSDNTTDMTGGIAILKRSLPVYRGWLMPFAGIFRHTNYAYYVIRCDAADQISVEYDTIEVGDVKPLSSFSTSAYQVSGSTNNPPMLDGVSKRYVYPSVPANYGWMRSGVYGMGLYCLKAYGGGQRTYENTYVWIYPVNTGGTDSVQVHGSVCGCAAIFGRASVRSVYGFDHAGASYSRYAGAFAVLLNQGQN